MNTLIPNNFARASRKSSPRGVFLNGGPDGAFPFFDYYPHAQALFNWCSLFAAHAARHAQYKPETVVGWSGGGFASGFITPRFHGDDPIPPYEPEFVINRAQRPDRRLVETLEAIRNMPLQNEPELRRRKPAAQNWEPLRWFVEPRPFCDGYDVCTFVAQGRQWPCIPFPLALVKIALDSGNGPVPYPSLVDAMAAVSIRNQWPHCLPRQGDWRLVKSPDLGDGRAVPGWFDRTLGDRPQPRPLSELLAALKETAGMCWLYLRWAWRKIVSYVTK